MTESLIQRSYRRALALKYGCNPHQVPAAIYRAEGTELPFRVLNGTPGYINLLDALNAWQLVSELRQALGLAAAASFKHVSPAGAAVAVPLPPVLAQVYGVEGTPLSPPALAYVRARGADPMSSFGDFAAFSDPVDEATAALLKTEVSDGLIAPGFEGGALDLLKAKKGGGYIVLQAEPAFRPPEVELKEVFGVAFAQQRNAVVIGREHLRKVVTRERALPEGAVRDLILAAIAVKYTQSNSVGFALDGQVIGVGAGQQSRVECVKLAGRKAETWALRQHPRVLGLPFKAGVRKVERTNARVRYVEGDFAGPERAAWEALFERPPAPLTAAEKRAWLNEQLKGVGLASDAFFPFRDSIDQASLRGVAYIVQPGGSIADGEVIRACDEYGMAMAFSGVRLFHH
ncbi:MAG: phosphoribosylaminoimidazolecarboxamide formyltransferase [Candidatus Lambdaproteobacteria bacterium]|nr:phosphoribosylaminoimidazolecarboxamide formyltransferase [Candidatus Lambdaproteobacteria bacterium]